MSIIMDTIAAIKAVLASTPAKKQGRWGQGKGYVPCDVLVLTPASATWVSAEDMAKDKELSKVMLPPNLATFGKGKGVRVLASLTEISHKTDVHSALKTLANFYASARKNGVVLSKIFPSKQKSATVVIDGIEYAAFFGMLTPEDMSAKASFEMFVKEYLGAYPNGYVKKQQAKLYASLRAEIFANLKIIADVLVIDRDRLISPDLGDGAIWRIVPNGEFTNEVIGADCLGQTILSSTTVQVRGKATCGNVGTYIKGAVFTVNWSYVKAAISDKKILDSIRMLAVSCWKSGKGLYLSTSNTVKGATSGWWTMDVNVHNHRADKSIFDIWRVGPQMWTKINPLNLTGPMADSTVRVKSFRAAFASWEAFAAYVSTRTDNRLVLGVMSMIAGGLPARLFASSFRRLVHVILPKLVKTLITYKIGKKHGINANGICFREYVLHDSRLENGYVSMPHFIKGRLKKYAAKLNLVLTATKGKNHSFVVTFANAQIIGNRMPATFTSTQVIKGIVIRDDNYPWIGICVNDAKGYGMDADGDQMAFVVSPVDRFTIADQSPAALNEHMTPKVNAAMNEFLAGITKQTMSVKSDNDTVRSLYSLAISNLIGVVDGLIQRVRLTYMSQKSAADKKENVMLRAAQLGNLMGPSLDAIIDLKKWSEDRIINIAAMCDIANRDPMYEAKQGVDLEPRFAFIPNSMKWLAGKLETSNPKPVVATNDDMYVEPVIEDVITDVNTEDLPVFFRRMAEEANSLPIYGYEMFHFVAEQIGKEFEDCGAFLPVNVNVDKKVIEKVANDLIETGLLAGVTKVGRFSWDGFHAVEKPYGLVTKGYVHGNLNWGYVWDNVTMNKIACLSKLGKYEEATELLDMVFTVVNAMPEDERIANELALLLVAVSNVYGNESKNPGMSRVLGVFFRVRPETLAAFITLLKQGNDAPNA